MSVVFRMKRALLAIVLFAVPILGLNAAHADPLADNGGVTVEAIGADGPEMEGPEIPEPDYGEPRPWDETETPVAGDPERAPASIVADRAPASIAAELEDQTEAVPVAADPLMEAAADPLQSLEPPLDADSAEIAPTADPASREVDVAAVTPDEKTDIYDRWSKKKFRRPSIKQHPLALRNPKDFVVVCEAGCSNGPEQIVYQEPKDARGPVNTRSLRRGAVAGTGSIDCVGGCYGNRLSYATARRARETARQSAATGQRDDDTSWMSTAGSSSDNESKKKKSRWYQRIN